MSQPKVVVTGAGGFVGGHLVARLRRETCWDIRAVDVKPLDQWFQSFDDVENVQADLQLKEPAREALRGAQHVYNLAADMGGVGALSRRKARCMLAVLINTHLLLAAREHGVQRYFFASSACVYNTTMQTTTEAAPLRESDAYPAMPDDGYGWEKLFSERMCRHFTEDFGVPTRVARFHNIYGPQDAWRGGRERVVAALCRKVIQAADTGSHEIEIWGDGTQSRTFTYVDDCVEGIRRLMEQDDPHPVNLGASELVTINQLVDLIEDIAVVKLKRRYLLDAPRGVQGRNSDNTRIRQLLHWEPSIPLRDGLATTFRWIYEQYCNDPARGLDRDASASDTHVS